MQMALEDWLELTFYGNTALDWILAAAVGCTVFIVLRFARALVTRRLAAAPSLKLAAGLVRRLTTLFLLIIAVYAAARMLQLPTNASQLVNGALALVIFFQLARLGSHAFLHWTHAYVRRRRDDSGVATTIGAVRFLGQVAIWSLAFLLALDNLGFDITALVAGLGITGIAVAFALQSILGDIFASISIILDKPFEVGDFIIVGDVLGSVERVGIKTTRLRSLFGEQIIMSNNDLLQSRIRNYKRMEERRITFKIGVTYQTPVDKLERIPALLRAAVEEQKDKVRFDRAHFQSFGDFALLFEVVYYVLDPDYNLMMDIQQAINLKIARTFEEQEIDFAYPTQTLFLERAAKTPAVAAAAP